MSKLKIPQKVVDELNRQFNQELSAAHSYLALSVWCDVRNLKGFGKYFVKQAGEEGAAVGAGEQRHVPRQRDQHHLCRLGQRPCRRRALDPGNTLGVNAVFEAAVAAKDGPAQVLMHWFISEQVEEEDWSTEMVERVQAASCSGGMSDLDRHIERYLSEEVREVPGEK
ncbi:MAG: ferritin-like domain-containing protein [Opitutaceae bacterium]